MIVKVSKTMAAELKKRLAPYGYRVDYIEMTENTYAERVDYWTIEHLNDYKSARGTFATIRIIYPPEFYCIPRYLTTNCLKACFKYSDTTPDGFFQSVIDEISV